MNPETSDFLVGLPRQPRLLVVDDQAIQIQVLYRALAPDCQVLMATSGEAALRLCQERLPDLVLLDVEMPEMDGFEVLRRLKADPLTREVPVIFVTGHTSDDVESRCLEAGAVDYISKPINPRVVRSRVKTHLMLKFQSDLLRDMVFVDPLTNSYNRRYFDQRLAVEWSRAARSVCVINASKAFAESSTARPAAVVPPGLVTRAANASGVCGDDAASIAAPSVIDSANCAAMSRGKPAASPPFVNASMKR